MGIESREEEGGERDAALVRSLVVRSVPTLGAQQDLKSANEAPPLKGRRGRTLAMIDG